MLLKVAFVNLSFNKYIMMTWWWWWQVNVFLCNLKKQTIQNVRKLLQKYVSKVEKILSNILHALHPHHISNHNPRRTSKIGTTRLCGIKFTVLIQLPNFSSRIHIINQKWQKEWKKEDTDQALPTIAAFVDSSEYQNGLHLEQQPKKTSYKMHQHAIKRHQSCDHSTPGGQLPIGGDHSDHSPI